MTNAEFTRLEKLVKASARTAKQDAEQRGATLLADAEAKLAAIYAAEDRAFADVTAKAGKLIAKADAVIAKRCEQLGIPKKFRPRLRIAWSERGENSCPYRRAELRKVAETQIQAMIQQAKVQIAREEVEQLRQLTAHGLESPQAVAFLGKMPHAEELLPPVVTLRLASGECVSLDDVTARNDVTPERNAVPSERNGESRKCEHCGEALKPGQGSYCKGACRQAAYRQRKAALPDKPATGSPSG
jgi:hypothetical protein